MKFPHELSKERLSLLSEEDRKIYDMEHSGLYSLEPKIVPNVGVIDEDAKIMRQMEQFLFESQFDELFDKELIEVVGEEEYMNIKKNLFEFIENDPEMQGELFEAPGHAADWWLPNGLKIGWLGKLAAGLLTGLLGIAAWLFMKGKDRLAMKKLKQYMNKLVELIDMGVNKKRPWYSFLMVSKKNRQNTGEYNKACFRTIQETAERNMACLYTQCIHNLGFLNPGITDFRGITSGMMPEEGSGLDDFARIIADNVKTLEDYDKKYEKAQLLPIEPDLRKFNTLKLPALPTNYTMLMCNIEYPAKADKNPNGSLFMKPTQEILQAKAEDLGLTYFANSTGIDDIIHWEKETPAQQQENDSFNYALKNPYIQMLLEAEEQEEQETQQEDTSDANQEENKTDQNTRAGRGSKFDPHGGLLTGDIDNEIIGGELETHTEGKRTTKLNTFNGIITDAIDGYMRSSIPVIQKLVKAICGNQQSRDVGGFEQMIAQLINAGEGKMSDFMKKNDSVLKQILDDRYDKELKEKDGLLEIERAVLKLIKLVDSQKFKNDFLAKRNLTDTQFKSILFKIRDKKIITNEKQFNQELKTELNITMNVDQLVSKYSDNENKSEKYSFTVYRNNLKLFEDEQHRDVTVGTSSDNDILNTLHKDLDTTYEEVKNYITEHLASMINSDPKDWYIITSSRDRMNKLKEAADKEINAKIELICRLAGEGKTDIGDKFKSAISKHPMRAESLKRIWAMYSDDLSDRMETRIRSITGDNGNSNILTTIKQFLINVYPNLMAIMIYYKQIFFLINLYTRQNPLPLDLKKKENQKDENGESTLNDARGANNLERLDNDLNNEEQNNEEQTNEQ